MNLNQLKHDIQNGDIHQEHMDFVLNSFSELQTLLLRIKDITSTPHDYMVEKVNILVNVGLDILGE